jgi:hypothetical protein
MSLFPALLAKLGTPYDVFYSSTAREALTISCPGRSTALPPARSRPSSTRHQRVLARLRRAMAGPEPQNRENNPMQRKEPLVKKGVAGMDAIPAKTF